MWTHVSPHTIAGMAEGLARLASCTLLVVHVLYYAVTLMTAVRTVRNE